MTFRKSIRWRIQVWHGLLLLAMTVGFGIATYRLETANARRGFDEELRTRLGVLGHALDRGGARPGPPPRGFPGEGPPGGERREPPDFESAEVRSLFGEGENPFYFVIWRRSGERMASSSQAPVDVSKPERPTGQAAEQAGRIHKGVREQYLFTPPGECLLVGRSTRRMDRAMDVLAWRITLIGGAVMAFGLAVGWWIATRSLRPISQISTAATRIAGGHLDERIRTEETDSELGKLAAVLNHTFERLDTAFAEQARFTSDAAHELRTPVSIILAQSQLSLSRERTVESYRETIETSRRAALRMRDLTESLLELAVLDDGRSGRDFAVCDLQAIAAEQIELAHPLAGEKGIGIMADLNPARVAGDAAQLGRLLLNLLGNAVKFCPAGAKVEVATRAESGSVVLSVSDNGPGIPPEHLPRLFERFYRVESSRNRVSGGAGLGLAICKRVAHSHGGELTVSSEVGEGTTFTLRVPVSS